MKKYLLSLIVFLLSGCGEEKATSEAVHCANHFRAQSYKVAKESCQLAADAGDREAQWILANIYLFDSAGNEAVWPKIRYYLQQAADNGHRRAAMLLGELYHDGTFGQRDLAQAKYWFKPLAKKGDAEAQYHLAWVLADEQPIDFSQVLHWLRSAASRGHADSLNDLAWIYATAPDGRYFEPAKAQQLIEQIDEQNRRKLHIVDTEAAVAAANGDFAKALALQEQVLHNRRLDGNGDTGMERRFRSYQKQQRWLDNDLPWEQIENSSNLPAANSPKSPSDGKG